MLPGNASLGLTFYDGTMFPQEYRGDLFAAEHGSWNRSSPSGLKKLALVSRKTACHTRDVAPHPGQY